MRRMQMKSLGRTRMPHTSFPLQDEASIQSSNHILFLLIDKMVHSFVPRFLAIKGSLQAGQKQPNYFQKHIINID